MPPHPVAPIRAIREIHSWQFRPNAPNGRIYSPSPSVAALAERGRLIRLRSDAPNGRIYNKTRRDNASPTWRVALLRALLLRVLCTAEKPRGPEVHATMALFRRGA